MSPEDEMPLAIPNVGLQARIAILEAHPVIGGGTVQRWDGKVVEAEVDA